MPQRMLRLPEVIRRTGLSRTTIYTHAAAGLFPRPLRLGLRMVGWPETEIDAINSARMRSETEPEIRALVMRLQESRRGAA